VTFVTNLLTGTQTGLRNAGCFAQASKRSRGRKLRMLRRVKCGAHGTPSMVTAGIPILEQHWPCWKLDRSSTQGSDWRRQMSALGQMQTRAKWHVSLTPKADMRGAKTKVY
jgi:hypothetical protein